MYVPTAGAFGAPGFPDPVAIAHAGAAACVVALLDLVVAVEGLLVVVTPVVGTDTVTGDDAERLYERLGWTRVGVIPNYALYPDGRLCATTVFYKQLRV